MHTLRFNPITFKSDPIQFVKNLNCTTSSIQCPIMNIVNDYYRSVTQVMIVHFSGAKCRRKNMKVLGQPLTYISRNDAKAFEVNLINKCVVPRLCTSLSELTVASCSMKHAIAWTAASVSRHIFSVIIEDDMLFEHDLYPMIVREINMLPVDWHIFNFGCVGSPMITRKSVLCSRGYALSRRGAEIMTQIHTRITDPADSMILHASRHMHSYFKILPMTHGSYLGDRPLPRGTDLCNRSRLNYRQVMKESKRYYRSRNALFKKPY